MPKASQGEQFFTGPNPLENPPFHANNSPEHTHTHTLKMTLDNTFLNSQLDALVKY